MKPAFRLVFAVVDLPETFYLLAYATHLKKTGQSTIVPPIRQVEKIHGKS